MLEGTKVSKAQQKAVNKYVKNNYDRINVTFPKGKKEMLKEYATKYGESVNSFIVRAVNETMERGILAATDVDQSTTNNPQRKEVYTMTIPQKQLYTEADYYALPEDIRAELIDGQIYYQAAPSRIHQRILSELHTLINIYIKSKGGSCEVYPAPFAVKLMENRSTIVEPDISVICDHAKLTDKGCTGAPDWIIEIVSPGNSSHDYIHKLNLYADAGVREYWIVNPMKKSIYVYHLEETKFETSAYSFQNKIKVNIYDDLWIDFQEIIL